LFGSSYELLYLASAAGKTWSRPCDAAIVANSSGERESQRDDTSQFDIKHQHIYISNIHPQSQLSTTGRGSDHVLARPTIQIKQIQASAIGNEDISQPPFGCSGCNELIRYSEL